MISVLVVDDQPMIRLGIRAILDAQPDMTVAGEAGDGGPPCSGFVIWIRTSC
jgi:DNA-binding NarL/FixJ family response regulator